MVYRIFRVGEDGHFAGPPHEVDCSNDGEAVAIAMQIKDGVDLEIWDHKRFVVRLTMRPPSRPRGAKNMTIEGVRSRQHNDPHYISPG
jgi:hypothetical protein